MQPFFTFFGSKWQMARRLGRPRHPLVVEPFAGSACYSVYWGVKRAILVDLDPIISSIWDYLIHVPAAEIMRIPADIADVDDPRARLCQEAKWLIGYWIDPGRVRPLKLRGNWATKIKNPHMNVWNVRTRMRVAQQVEKIRSWKIIHGPYEQAPNVEAHWHIDPPYVLHGHHYRYSSKDIDYAALAHWCLRRRGFVQVCEGTGADWLPFQRFTELTGMRAQSFATQRNGKSYYEVLYQSGRELTDLTNPIKERISHDEHEQDRTGVAEQDRRASQP